MLVTACKLYSVSVFSFVSIPYMTKMMNQCLYFGPLTDYKSVRCVNFRTMFFYSYF